MEAIACETENNGGMVNKAWAKIGKIAKQRYKWIF